MAFPPESAIRLDGPGARRACIPARTWFAALGRNFQRGVQLAAKTASRRDNFDEIATSDIVSIWNSRPKTPDLTLPIWYSGRLCANNRQQSSPRYLIGLLMEIRPTARKQGLLTTQLLGE